MDSQLWLVDNLTESKAWLIDSSIGLFTRLLVRVGSNVFTRPFQPVSGDKYPWGSNSFVLNNMVVMALAYDLTKNDKYLTGVIDGAERQRAAAYTRAREALLSPHYTRLNLSLAARIESATRAWTSFEALPRRVVHGDLKPANVMVEPGDAVLLLLLVADLVDAQRLADDLQDRLAGVQRGERVLKDDLHALSQWPHVALAGAEWILGYQQQRIAAMLDQAEALRAKRRQALAKLDTLTQSLFLDLFGHEPLQEVVGRVIIQFTGLLHQPSNALADVLLVFVCCNKLVNAQVLGDT